MADESRIADPIVEGLRAWTTGDLDALEAVLDPQVTLSWIEPGPWDCCSRGEVMRLLRRRQAEQGAHVPAPVRIDQLDEGTYVVSAEKDSGPGEPQIATRVQVVGDKVVTMEQFRSVAV
jgi:hypothetical protein